MSTAITENISKNSTRGRPAVMSAEQEAQFVALGLFSASSPRRSKMNVYYRQRAICLLKNGDFKWLFDVEKVMADGGGTHWKPVVLTELGRIEDDELMVTVAAQLCEMKPKTRDAVLMVRRVRTGGLPRGDTLQLANEIINVINRYLHSHAEVAKQDVIDALLAAGDSVEGSLS